MNGKESFLVNLLADNSTDKWLWGGVQWEFRTLERMKDERALENYGYKVYSQNDEDGIIEEIFKRIGTSNKKFIEFGVQNGLESNTHFLLFKGWEGLWIECDREAYREIQNKFVNVIRDGQLHVLNDFITKDNINELFEKAGLSGEIDLLSIDIDGNDYYVFDAISKVSPRVVIMEYNGKFPPNDEWVMAYNENHIWDGTDRHGASLKALELLADKKGYQLVGTNINGCNAFFVKKELAKGLFVEPATAENLFNPMRVNLKHRSGHPSRNCLYKQRKGIDGVLDFYPETRVYVAYGFDDIEVSGKMRYRYMNSKEAKLYIRLSKPKSELIRLRYINPFAGQSFRLTIEQGGGWKEVAAYEITDGRGEICIPLSRVDREAGGVALDFRIDHLLSPKEVLNLEDYRQLGIGILIDEIEEENNEDF